MMSCRCVDPVLRIESIGDCAKDFCPALEYSVVVFWLRITSGLNMELGNVWFFPVHVIVRMLSPTLLNDKFGLCYALPVCF